jgi:hypothetical protein
MVWFGLGCGLMAQLPHQYFDCISLWIHFFSVLTFPLPAVASSRKSDLLIGAFSVMKNRLSWNTGRDMTDLSKYGVSSVWQSRESKKQGRRFLSHWDQKITPPSPEWLTNKPLLSATCAYPFKWHYWFASSNNTETSHSFTNFSSYQVATFLPILNNSTT